MILAWQTLPRLQCCAGASLRCSGRAVRWAMSSAKQRRGHIDRAMHSENQPAQPCSRADAQPLSRLQPLHRRRRAHRAAFTTAAAADAGNGSSEKSDHFVITTPLYYVNAGRAYMTAIFVTVALFDALLLTAIDVFHVLAAAPHLGGAYSTMSVDVMARYQVSSQPQRAIDPALILENTHCTWCSHGRHHA